MTTSVVTEIGARDRIVGPEAPDAVRDGTIVTVLVVIAVVIVVRPSRGVRGPAPIGPVATIIPVPVTAVSIGVSIGGMSFTVVVVTPWPDGAGIDTAASSNATTPNWSRANTRTAKTANARTGKMRTAHAGTAKTAHAGTTKVNTASTTKVTAALCIRGGRKSGRRQDQRCADRSNFQHENSPVSFIFRRHDFRATGGEFALILVNRKKVIVQVNAPHPVSAFGQSRPSRSALKLTFVRSNSNQNIAPQRMTLTKLNCDVR